MPLVLARQYTGTPEEGPLGPGWSFSYDQRLRMYGDYSITEFRGDGSHMTFRFVKGAEEYVNSYDGDNRTTGWNWGTTSRIQKA